ncbi:MAG: type III pantothenate kinase [Pseudomonadota bacterium]
MLLVIDSGNTRTKWALVDSTGVMHATAACLNADLVTSALKQVAQKANKVLVANVAGEALAQQITQLLAPLEAHFVVAKQECCDVINGYKHAEKLGADRWAGLIAAWHINHQPTLVINAGTAITVDCLALDENGTGLFLGGTITPGLRLMQAALTHNTAQLKVNEGSHMAFPLNTENAIQSGCLNAAIGAISVMLKQLEKHNGFQAKLLISGGDASAIAGALMAYLEVDEKRVMIVENLVLQGLAILQKEYI